MTVHLDTSVMVEAFIPNGLVVDRLRALAGAGDQPTFCTVALFEWLRGPRTQEELGLRNVMFPDDVIVPFGTAEADRAATIYRMLRSARRREADIAIAACAIEYAAALWTLNPDDFHDIPGLRLYAG